MKLIMRFILNNVRVFHTPVASSAPMTSFASPFYRSIFHRFIPLFTLSTLPWIIPPAYAQRLTQASSQEQEIVVYSSRMEQLIKPVFDTYTEKTGVAIKFLTDQEGPLLQRLLAEGANSPADLLITVDAGALWKATQEQLFQPITSPLLTTRIPANLRDKEGRWFGLSVRARTIVYNTKTVRPEALSTYEALGDPKWKKHLCLRTSKKIYNQSLIAMMIADLGEEQTEKIVRAWVANLATDVFSDDTQVIEAIAAGLCKVGIVNSYYYGRFIAKHPKSPLALFWPNQNGRGVHVNISGAGVLRHAKHKEAAVQFLEWLSSEEAQHLFADSNLEYPVNPKVAPHPAVAKWGTFRQSTTPVSRAGTFQIEAIKLIDRAGYK